MRREQGRGTFVARPRINAESTKIGGLRNGLHLDSRSKLQTRVLSCETRTCTEEEAKRLGLSAAATVWEVSRLRLLNKQPMIWESSVIPKILAPDLAGYLNGSDKRSLYDLASMASTDLWQRGAAEEQTPWYRARALARPEHGLLDLASFRVGGGSLGGAVSRRGTRAHRCISVHAVFVAKSFAFRLETAPTFFVEAVEVIDSQQVRKAQ